MLTRDPILAQEPNDQPEQPISGSERVEATKAVVLLVEEDALLRRQLLQAVPPKVGAQAFPGLDELDGAKFRPGSPVVLVLGPSQATAETLERVSALLRATRGAGAVLVVQHPSAKLMSLALRSGVNDAIELSDVGAQLARSLGDLAYRLDEEAGRPADEARAWIGGTSSRLCHQRLFSEGGRGQVSGGGQPGHRPGPYFGRTGRDPGF